MTLSQSIQDFLAMGGYAPQDTEFGFQFKYKELDFIHFKDEQRENFFNLFFPQIFEVTESNRADVMKAMNEANAQIIVAKGSIRFGNAVWVGVESFLPAGASATEIVMPSIEAMLEYRNAFYSIYSQTPSGEAEIKAAQSK